MELFGYIVSALNLVAIYTITVCRQGNLLCGDVKSKVETNFKSAYREFGNSIPLKLPYEPAFELSVNRLYRLHNAIQKISKVEDELRIGQRVAMIGLAVVILSVSIGMFLPAEKEAITELVLKFVIPLVVLFYEGILLYKSLMNEGTLNELKVSFDEEIRSYKDFLRD